MFLCLRNTLFLNFTPLKTTLFQSAHIIKFRAQPKERVCHLRIKGIIAIFVFSEKKLFMDTKEYFLNRATVRNFDPDRHISDDTLAEFITMASHAPNTGNMQLYSIVVTRDPEMKTKVSRLHYDQPAAKNADVLLTVCADVHRFDEWCRNRKAESGLNNFGGRLSAVVDAGIFAQQLVTIAEMQGVGCCYLGTAMYNVDDFCQLLNLPEGVVPVVGIAMGYPADGKSVASDRLPVEAVMHLEKYSDYTPADIDGFYREKESLPESAQFIAENGKETLAQVYADIRYPRTLNEAVGAAMTRHLN